METLIALLLLIVIITGIFFYRKSSSQKTKQLQQKLKQEFPKPWRKILQQKVLFYMQLDGQGKAAFEKRVQLFLATKNIEGIDTNIDDAIKLVVASSAIIPTFAFPEYNYPGVRNILIYPNSFDEDFQTQRFEGHKEHIVGMVGNRFQNGTVILSKPDLVKAFDGLPHKENVGVHEFVHLLDKEDGAIDGIPELLMTHRFVGPWLHEIKAEARRIQQGNSDINPYALTSNAEFLAVVSEYLLDNPDKFQKRHPELYQLLSAIFNKKEIGNATL